MRAFGLVFLIVLPAAAGDDDLERLRRDVAQLRTRAVEAEARAEVASKALDEARARYVALEERNERLIASLEGLTADLRELSEANRRHKEWVDRFAKESEALAKRNAELKEENEKLRFWLRKYRKRYPEFQPEEKGPTGKVIAVEKSRIVLSCGSRGGLEVGDVVQLRRGSTYVGQAVVLRVDPEQSIAEFETEFTGKGAPPRPGDLAEVVKKN
jgi:predicted RNase H-like nuclease (RuvC/YqgF family)